MKRYKIAHRYVGGLGVEEDIRGEWVKWEDVKDLVYEKGAINMEKNEIVYEITGDSDQLRAELFEHLRAEDRIDNLTIEKFKNPPQANFPNRKITITFYSKEE